jgi:hypothetical protein
MKIVFIILGAAAIVGVLIFLTSCRNGPTKTDKTETIKTNDIKPADNMFPELRSRAFTMTPDLLGLTLLSDKTVVYGVIMDWEIDGGISTTVSFQTGDASLYFSSGGGIIGGGQHKNVSTAAIQFVSLAQTYLDKAVKTDNTPLPDKNVVIFYLLTNKGIYSGQEIIQNFENNSSKWLGLFEEGNKVITELRLTSEQK